jgi:hypothetical protein
VFYIQEVAKAYGELVSIVEFAKTIKLNEGQSNSDTNECMQILFDLNAVYKISLDMSLLVEVGYFTQVHTSIIRK